MDYTEPRYHPLVNADTDSTEMVPMFMSTDGTTIRKVHSAYLTEIVPNYFRLYSRKPVKNNIIIHCPRCGAELFKMADATDSSRLGLYTCKKCSQK